MGKECKTCLGRPGGVAAFSTQAGGSDGGRPVLQADPMLLKRDVTCFTPSKARPRQSGEPNLRQYASHGKSNSLAKATARCRLVAMQTRTDCVRSPRIKKNSLLAVAQSKAVEVWSVVDRNHAQDRQGHEMPDRLTTHRWVCDRRPSCDSKGIQRKVTSTCLLYTSPSPRDATLSRMPSSA